MDREEFIESIRLNCIDSCNRWGLYPSICIAQLCLESKYGTSELAVNANNIAGKKWNKDRFEPYYRVTKEYLDGTVEDNLKNGFVLINAETGLYEKSLPFNIYSSWAECIEHYCENIVKGKWYKRAMDVVSDYDEFLDTLSSIYAPNHPTYTDDVRRVIIENELSKFD